MTSNSNISKRMEKSIFISNMTSGYRPVVITIGGLAGGTTVRLWWWRFHLHGKVNLGLITNATVILAP
jgi:hypothetical protein